MPFMTADVSRSSTRERRAVRLPLPATARRAWAKANQRALLFAVVAALLVGFAGELVVMGQRSTYASSVAIAMVPGKSDPAEAASLFDTLSRGQIVATAAELYGQSRWHQKYPDVTVTAGGVPPSSVVRVSARGSDPAQVREALLAVVQGATPQVNALLTPYVASLVSGSVSTPERVGLSRTILLLAVLLAASVVGAATYQAVRLVQRRSEAGLVTARGSPGPPP